MLELSETITYAIREWADDPDAVGYEIYNVLGDGGVSELSEHISRYISEKFVLKPNT